MKRTMRSFVFFLLASITGATLYAQDEYPLNNALHYSLEQKMIADTNFHFSIKPYAQKEIPLQSDSCNTDSSMHLSISPALTLLPIVIKDQRPAFLSIYGLFIRSEIRKKLVFDIDLYGGSFTLSDALYHLQDSLSVLPHFTNHYRLHNQTASFFNVTGNINFSPNKIFTFSAGKGKQFWGTGYRSLFLSDNTNPYPYLKADVSVWKIKYVWLVSFLQGRIYYDTTGTHWQSKYTASHFLSWNLSKWFNLNLFETVVWRGRDSLGVRNLDIHYLNPIIFYRPVEFSLGSPDNVIMGAGWNIKIRKKILVYHQFIFDEFKLAEIKSGQGWWGNKYGFQLGTKVFLKNTMLLTEYNWVRPFTYSHRSALEAYGAWRQSLAHPLGANFDEWLIETRHQKGKHSFRFFMSTSRRGLSDTFNTGGNIFRSYDDNPIEYGNTMFQGTLTTVTVFNFTYGYNILGSSYTQLLAGCQLTSYNKQKPVPFFFIGIKTNFMNYYLEDYLR